MKLKDIELGSIVIDPNSTFYGSPIQWYVLANNHYGNGGTLLLSRFGLKFIPFDVKESDSKKAEYQANGRPDYKTSNLRQWLNSDGFNWFKPQHPVDSEPNQDNAPINWYSDEEGFLTGLSRAFKDNIKETDLIYSTISSMDSYVKDKIFLLSNAELGTARTLELLEEYNIKPYGMGVNDKIDSGIYTPKPIEYFVSNKAKFYCYPTQEAIDSYKGSTTSKTTKTTVNWWTRDGNGLTSQFLYGTTATANTTPFNAEHCVRPSLCLDMEVDVVEIEPTDGIKTYELLPKEKIRVDLEKTDLGYITNEVNIKFTVNGATSSRVEIRLDKSIIHSFEALEGEHIIKINDYINWDKLDYGLHKVDILATDMENLVFTSNTLTFTKYIEKLSLINKFSYDLVPKYIKKFMASKQLIKSRLIGLSDKLGIDIEGAKTTSEILDILDTVQKPHMPVYGTSKIKSTTTGFEYLGSTSKTNFYYFEIHDLPFIPSHVIALNMNNNTMSLLTDLEHYYTKDNPTKLHSILTFSTSSSSASSSYTYGMKGGVDVFIEDGRIRIPLYAASNGQDINWVAVP